MIASIHRPTLLWTNLLCLFLVQTMPAYSWVHLAAPASYLSGVPVLVRVEMRQGDNRPDRTLWNATATLRTEPPGAATLSTNQVHLRNGLGVALVTVNSANDFSLIAEIGAQSASRALTNASLLPVTTASGTLPGSATLWEGVVRVTGDVTVPAGHTLTVAPGTWVLLTGAASGSAGVDLLVSGSLQCQGTEEAPVSFVVADAANSANGWGEIRFASAQGTFRHTFLTRGGRSPGVGHTGAGPVLRPQNSTLLISDSAVAYNAGKVMYAENGSSLVLSNSVFARSVMGPEVEATSLLAEHCWFMEMFGPDDNDGIYMHRQQANQSIRLASCVFALCDDETVDCLNARLSMEDCIMRNAFDKGISQIAGTLDIRRCLIADCAIGISIKGQDANVTGVVNVNQTTIRTANRGVAVENKFGIANVDLQYFITNSIVRATVNPANSVYTDYNASAIHIYYSNVGEPWAGPGNLTSDPAFMGPTDFRLLASSPCIDSGDPLSPRDLDGSRADMGCYPFLIPAPLLEASQWLDLGEDLAFGFEMQAWTNRTYAVEYSDDFSLWNHLTTVVHQANPALIRDLSPPTAPRFYRVRTVLP